MKKIQLGFRRLIAAAIALFAAATTESLHAASTSNSSDICSSIGGASFHRMNIYTRMLYIQQTFPRKYSKIWL